MRRDWATPVLCLVTDRRRLTRTLEEPDAVWESVLIRQIAGAIRGGIDVVQIRERDLEAGILAAFVRRCVAAARGTATRIVVNDRLDVALAAGADGVHLREDSLSSAAARTLMKSPGLIGRSVHDPAGATNTESLDYLIAGAVFETVSKPRTPPLGLAGLRAVVTAAGACPVWAIGGITPEQMPLVAGAGARGVAAIGAFLPRTLAQIEIEVQKISADLRFSFDSSTGVP
jgi:thiamine-phosphate pyrophosphorylase